MQDICKRTSRTLRACSFVDENVRDMVWVAPGGGGERKKRGGFKRSKNTKDATMNID